MVSRLDARALRPRRESIDGLGQKKSTHTETPHTLSFSQTKTRCTWRGCIDLRQLGHFLFLDRAARRQGSQKAWLGEGGERNE